MTAVAMAWPTPPTESDSRRPIQWETRYVSDLPYTAIANGLGPVERDATNGGDQPEDGEPIDVDGVRYDHGLGVHPHSQVRIYRPPECLQFVSVVAALAVEDDGGQVGSRYLVTAGHCTGQSRWRPPTEPGRWMST